MSGDDCTCWVTPESQWFRYGSAVEPGSAMEPNPDCPEHFPVPEMFPGTLAALNALTIRKATP